MCAVAVAAENDLFVCLFKIEVSCLSFFDHFISNYLRLLLPPLNLLSSFPFFPLLSLYIHFVFVCYCPAHVAFNVSLSLALLCADLILHYILAHNFYELLLLLLMRQFIFGYALVQYQTDTDTHIGLPMFCLRL